MQGGGSFLSPYYIVLILSSNLDKKRLLMGCVVAPHPRLLDHFFPLLDLLPLQGVPHVAVHRVGANKIKGPVTFILSFLLIFKKKH